MPVPVIERALALMPHVDFVNAYGLTETSSTIAVLTPDDHREALASDDPAVRRRLGSVGRPSAAIESDDPRPVRRGGAADGEAGEIWVRGEQVSGEYIGREGGSDWFATRDGGFLDADGLPVHRGPPRRRHRARRREHLARRDRGRAARAPAVDDVAVYAIPSQEWGEDIGASVVLVGDVDTEELREWVRGPPALDAGAGADRHPHRAAVQRDRQAAAAGAQGRGRPPTESVSVAVTASAATVRPGDLGELFAAVSGDTATVLGGRTAAAGRRHGRGPAAGLVAGLGAGRRRRRRRR